MDNFNKLTQMAVRKWPYIQMQLVYIGSLPKVHTLRVCVPPPPPHTFWHLPTPLIYIYKESSPNVPLEDIVPATIYYCPPPPSNGFSGSAIVILHLKFKNRRSLFDKIKERNVARWVIGSIPHGEPIEIFIVPASVPRLR